MFDSSDLIAVFQTSKYELNEDASWAEGDWNGDRRFDSGDLIVAFQDGGFERGPRTTINAVPEPTAAILLALGVFSISPFRRDL